MLALAERKHEEFLAKREQKRAEWKEQITKKWGKSLDHQSYQFKIQEKKNTSSKQFLQEIKALAGKARTGPEMLGGTSFSPFFTAFGEKEWKLLGAFPEIRPDHPTSLSADFVKNPGMLP